MCIGIKEKSATAIHFDSKLYRENAKTEITDTLERWMYRKKRKTRITDTTEKATVSKYADSDAFLARVKKEH